MKDTKKQNLKEYKLDKISNYLNIVEELNDFDEYCISES